MRRFFQFGIDLVSADVLQYAGAGIEHVAEISDAARGNNSNNVVKYYQCTDQSKLLISKTTKILSNEKFPFESAVWYSLVGTGNQSLGYFADLIRGTRMGVTKKGSLESNTAYDDLSNYSSGVIGDRVRMGHRVRGNGTCGVCSARYLDANNPLSTPYILYAGGFQVRLSEEATSATTHASGESASVSE